MALPLLCIYVSSFPSTLWVTTPSMLRFVIASAVAICSLLAVGCGGPPSATASGTVKYAGQPVENGAIILQAYDNSGGAAKASIVGGKYTLGSDSGLTAGTYRVQIHGYKKSPNAAPQAPAGGAVNDPELAVNQNAGPPTGTDPNMYPYIPSQYNLTTELTVTIAPGENPGKDFDLKAATEKDAQP